MGKLTRHLQQSLPAKISLTMFFVAVLVFVLINGFFVVMSRHHLHTLAMNNASEALNTAVAQAERYLKSVETVTDLTARLVEDDFCPDSLMAYSRRIVQKNAFASGCSISARPGMFPEYGRYYSVYTVQKRDTVITVLEDEYEYFDYEWYHKAAVSGQAGWVDPFVDDNGGSLSADHMIASYCRPLYDKENRLLGVLSTDISLPEFSRVLSSIKPYPNSYLILLGHDGRYYVHRDSTKIVNKTIFDPTNGRYSPDKMALGYEMTAGHSGRMHAEVNDVHCLICYQPVPGTDWSAALISPEHDVMHKYHRLIIIILIIIFIGLLIIYVICRSAIARAFAPVKLLEEQAQRLAEGDYSTVITRGNEHSVVGNLQNSFADMQETLSHYIQDLHTAIEESARRNEELQEANSAMEEAIRRKGEFVANMTHQIRTPLNLIMGFSQLIRDAGESMSAEEKQTLIQVIDYHTMTLSRMSLMLYDSSDRGYHDEMASLCYENVSCNEVARESIGYVNRYFPDVSVKFETTLEDSFTIISDHLYFMRSLREILYNSAKYSDGKNISLRVMANKESVQFIFEDTGPGISPDYQKNIFTPFYKFNTLSEGLGVGLPLTKRHVIMLGGSLELDSDYHQGCRFIMVFPLENPQASLGAEG